MTTVRALIAVSVLVLLTRAGRVAWHHRALTFAVWRAIRWRHLAGALALFAVVAGAATTLIDRVPLMARGLGDLVGLHGNAVFSPLEQGLSYAGPAPTSGPDWLLLAAATVFLGALVLVLPWLAYVEEELFRAGLEDASWPRVLVASAVFGLVHLAMLVPLGAATAIGLAGVAYAVVYRRAARAAGAPPPLPTVALRAYRPTRRARAAAARAQAPSPAPALPVGPDGGGLAVDVAPYLRQATGVFRAAVWHTTFNSLVVAAVWLSIVTTAL